MKLAFITFSFVSALFSPNLANATPQVHGHRGARSSYPENTLPAFNHAIESGADYLELDLGVTKDRALVLSHERRIDPDLCKGALFQQSATPPLILDLLVRQIKTLDCGSIRHEKFLEQKLVPGIHIPTLEEFLIFVKNHRNPNAKNIQFNIETKIDPLFPLETVSPDDFSRLLYQILKKYRVIERTVVQSFDFRTLVAIKKLEPKIRTSALIEDPKLNWDDIIKTIQPWAISPHYSLLTQERVTSLKEKKILLIPWTANDENTWKLLLDHKVDGIITDDPKGLIQYLRPSK